MERRGFGRCGSPRPRPAPSGLWLSRKPDDSERHSRKSRGSEQGRDRREQPCEIRPSPLALQTRSNALDFSFARPLSCSVIYTSFPRPCRLLCIYVRPFPAPLLHRPFVASAPSEWLPRYPASPSSPPLPHTTPNPWPWSTPTRVAPLPTATSSGMSAIPRPSSSQPRKKTTSMASALPF